MSTLTRCIACSLTGLVLAGCAVFPDDTPRTLGRVSDTSLPQKSGLLLASTPTLLRYQSSPRIETDPDLAIAHYEAVANATTDSSSQSEAMRRAAYLRLRQADQSANFDGVPAAINSYEALLTQKPHDPNNDLALYQLARAYQLDAQLEKAEHALRRLQSEHPDSGLMDDAVFRMAELAFLRRQYDQAAADYQTVINHGSEGRFFAMARYKLGWAEYRRQNYREAIAVFAEILDESLPVDVGHEPAALADQLEPGAVPWVMDALKITSLSLAALGGNNAFASVFGGPANEPHYAPLLYSALAGLLLEQERFSDAALAYAQFSQRHPQHSLAPEFDRQEVAVNRDAGFVQPAAQAMMRFIARYAPGAPYWQKSAPSAQSQSDLREYLYTLGRHFHALAQQTEKAEDANNAAQTARANYLAASRWHQRFIDIFPDDKQVSETEYLLAESFAGAGQPMRAAEQFQKVVSLYPRYVHAQEAAYSAVVLIREQADSARSPALRHQRQKQAIAASRALAKAFPDHAQWLPVMLRTAEDLTELKMWEPVQQTAERIRTHPRADAQSRYRAETLLADSLFAQSKFAAAEAAYARLLNSQNDKEGARTAQRLATAIYRQAENARDQDAPRDAAQHFLRIGTRLPQSPLRTDADFNAAAILLSLDEFAAAEPVLEDIVWRAPEHQLASEARRRLAIVYESQDKTALAASAYAGVSNDAQFSATMRREAAWKASELFEQAGQTESALSAYAAYVRRFPTPLATALDARKRLAALSRDALGNLQEYSRWLSEIVSAEKSAGGQRTAVSREQAAQAALELGRLEAARASGLKIRPPIQRTIIARKQQTERALAWLKQAADARVEGITPAATYAMGVAYADLANALLNAELPASLPPLEQEAIAILLEEQAYPFEEQAIALYEANLAHLHANIWGPWILRSAQALAEFMPAKYGKQEHLADFYDAES